MTGHTPPDLLKESRQSLLERHIVHDFGRRRVIANLQGCYGRLMGGVYRRLLPLVIGRRVIDCGCGFGQFSRVAIDAGFDVVSFDVDEESLHIARDICGIRPIRESVYATSLPNGSRDTAVCFDSIQHLDLKYFIPEIKRIGVRRIIIYESNNFNRIIRVYRMLSGHKESNDRTIDQLVAELEAHDFCATKQSFENIVALPLSGGFQRAPAPFLSRFPNAIRVVDEWLTRAARLARISRWVCFRFLIVVDLRG